MHGSLHAAVRCWRKWRNEDWPASGAWGQPDRRIIGFRPPASAARCLEHRIIRQSGQFVFDDDDLLRCLTHDEARQCGDVPCA